MERIDAFEKMLSDLQAQATCRQFLGNRLFYKQMFEMYRKYGLIW